MCYCGNNQFFELCCQPLLLNQTFAQSAEQLMRSRYSAYVVANANYLIDTTHLSKRHLFSKKSILQWAKENEWLRLEIVLSEEKRVVFKAFFKDNQGNEIEHYEDSIFDILGDKWYYVSGTFNE